ncbi:hypothetical protein [Skermanella pratensis]|uniref:hypothetical protein n=1 Tax=Skermanella pratensis TaxID=2233999 RepID=UPI0013012DE7|nr:hypothetical protein [Skermanella pratensis]
MQSDNDTPTISIKVFEGEQFLEGRVCRKVLLPDQVAGVIWRGLAYPLLEGSRIDIAGPAIIPGSTASTPRSQPAEGRFTVIEGADEAYLLIQGSGLECEQAASRLGAVGFKVIRTGRYLGEPVDDVIPDWFIRFEHGPQQSGSLLTRVASVLAGVLACSGSSSTELRLRLVESELATAKAKEAALRVELARLKLTIAERENAEVWNEAKARTELDALQSALVEEARNRAAAEALALEAASTPRNLVQPRLRDEVSAVFESLLPRITLLRSSPEAIAAEFSDRRFLYRALAELSAGDEGLPANWKKLRASLIGSSATSQTDRMIPVEFTPAWTRIGAHGSACITQRRTIARYLMVT